MKKSIVVLSLGVLFIIGGLSLAVAQEQPKPKKDTVNMDTDAKPTFYYAASDEKDQGKTNSGKGSSTTIIIIAAAVVVAGTVVFYLLRKKK